MAPAEKFAAACELHAFGLEMKRLSLRRAYPTLSDEAVEELFLAWLAEAR